MQQMPLIPAPICWVANWQMVILSFFLNNATAWKWLWMKHEHSRDKPHVLCVRKLLTTDLVLNFLFYLLILPMLLSTQLKIYN